MEPGHQIRDNSSFREKPTRNSFCCWVCGAKLLWRSTPASGLFHLTRRAAMLESRDFRCRPVWDAPHDAQVWCGAGSSGGKPCQVAVTVGFTHTKVWLPWLRLFSYTWFHFQERTGSDFLLELSFVSLSASLCQGDLGPQTHCTRDLDLLLEPGTSRGPLCPQATLLRTHVSFVWCPCTSPGRPLDDQGNRKSQLMRGHGHTMPWQHNSMTTQSNQRDTKLHGDRPQQHKAAAQGHNARLSRAKEASDQPGHQRADGRFFLFVLLIFKSQACFCDALPHSFFKHRSVEELIFCSNCLDSWVMCSER